MPIFLDSHRGNDLPLDSIRDFLRAARGGSLDGFGVRPLDLYCGDDGRVFYVVAAPDEAAVRQSHAAEGVICPRVRRVQSLHATDELGDEVKAIVRSMIVAEQTSATLGGRGGDDEWLRQVG